ncbi:SusC/RagA family TonB-linked outer membrane protein [Kriegella aquimaris]|uniref:TonB-linked outer membrane protein, SusC/RagA family n=1 Tax=Kriegella aquimaris TaxID=192904 RepID=A0A1G9KI95_9FLAO|nr:TonB-dependent receptor [Kriegella aquimaris]SDL49349.1 TonB-linked outer membrane protein, SusC/RagA family [Kriegella aquimaris]
MERLIKNGLFLSILFLSCAIFAQEIKVSGIVTDDVSGTPIPGASVVEKGTTNGAATDFDGNYTLNVSADAVLVFSSLGYTTKEISVNGKTKIDVILIEDAAQLDEVVVVGYGTQKKENLTGAVGVVTAEDMGSQPITSAGSAMHGRVAGIQMIQGSSQPGRNSPVFQIRGVGTIRSGIDGQNSASAPLILIDGVQGTMDDIHPSDIESFSVLKDAASAAIYGVKAANGVVLITTKRGKDRAARVTINSYYGVQSATTTPTVMNPYQFALAFNEAYTNVGQPALYSDELLGIIKEGTDPRLYNGNLFDEGYRKAAPLINHYFSVTGGNDKVKYMISAGYQDHEGILIETGATRYNFRSNIDITLSEKFRAGLNIAGSSSDAYEPNYSGYGATQVVRDMIRKYPFAPIFQPDGTIAMGSSLLTPEQDANAINPIALAKYGGQDNRKTLRVIPNLYFEYLPIKELVIKVNGSANVESSRNTFRQNKLTVSDGTTITTNNGLGTLSERAISEQLTMLEITANYNKSFGESNLTLLGGYAYQKYRYDFLRGDNEGYSYDFLSELDAGDGNPSVSGNATEYSLLSYFGRVNYGYADKYLFEANIRYDGSSQFLGDNRFAVFPSFSVGWNLAKEHFMENFSNINLFKFRAGWGQLGNNQVGNYPGVPTINLNQPYAFGGSLAPGSAITALANPDITWETTTTTNIGLDARFFDHRLTIEGDYYIRKGTDVLLTPPIVSTLGNVTAPFQNFGAIENKGWETSIGYSDMIGEHFNFGVSFNWTHNDNKIIKLDDEFISANKIINREGEPINSFYGHRIVGIFQTDEQAQDSDTYGIQPGGATVSAGDYIWEDTNGDGIVDSKDKVIIGDPNIRNNYGFSLDMSYKGFDFRTVFQGVLGRDVEKGVFGYDARANQNMDTWFLDRWTPENTDTDVPRVARGYKYNTSLFVGPAISSAIVDASYLRMKHIEVGYSLPQDVISKFGIQKMRWFISGENVFTVTNFTDGYDPEDSRTFNNNNDSYPLAKTFSLGVNLIF